MFTQLGSTARNKHLAWGVALAASMISGTHGDASDPPRDEDGAARVGSFEAMTESAKGLDWEQESRRWSRAADRVFERNGWTSEAHQYALDMIHDVSAIPPWDIVGRFNAITECMRERYDLSPEQESQLKSAMAREWGGLLMHYGGVFLEQTTEILKTRVEQRPFTPEQVARWTKEGEPMMKASRESAERLKAELDSSLRSDQKERWERDWAAFDERWKAVESMRAEWAQGKWEPAQWGMDEDPIQQGLQMDRAEGAGSGLLPSSEVAVPGKDARPGRWLAHDPSTWVAYVRDVQQRYGLGPGQVDAAWSIHAELVERATTYLETRAARLDAVPENERATDPAYEPVRDIFEELRERIDAMLTDKQRERTDPAPRLPAER